MYLVVDCETNGLPQDWRAPISSLDNWPRAVQIAWVRYDDRHREVASACRIIRPEGWSIPPQAARVHGISTERARIEGLPARDVLYELHCAALEAQYFIAHNASFDGSVIAAEFLRQNWQPPFEPRTMICTMELSTDYCRLPGGPRGYKWPKLEELYRVLFGEDFDGAHDAGFDTAACARCFFELKNRGVLRVR
ncbi:MAG: 3'-5' exonuclease [Aeromicrobium sp.]|nr:3'-5' exonuclease [Aeromicrobium sp.]